MKIEQTTRTDPNDYRSWLEIVVDDEQLFSIGSGEPEDMTLGRDLGDAYAVIPMMKLAYEAGQRGEAFEVETKEV